MIKLSVGGALLLRNYVTLEGTYFDVREIVPVGNHAIVCGEMRAYGIKIYRGSYDYTSRPGAFAIVDTGRDGKLGLAALAACIHETDGAGGIDAKTDPFGRWRYSLPSAGMSRITQCRKGPHPGEVEYPLYALSRPLAAAWGGTFFQETWHPECKGWGGEACPRALHTPNRDGLVRCYRNAIILYEDILKSGVLPSWFVEDMRAVRKSQETKPNVLPDQRKGPLFLGGGVGDAPAFE